MKKARVLLIVSVSSLLISAAAFAAEDSITSYGNAVVTSLLRMDENITFYCDIADFPPIIGKNIPVRIKSLKQAQAPQENQRILVYLNDLLFSKDKPVSKIILKEIERGKSFCLLAEIEVDGKDLCDLLVQEKLADKVIEVKGASAANSRQTVTLSETEEPATAQEAAAPVTYVCSKSSKVYHRSTCSHAKRLDMTKAITFATSEEAAKTGRRPCKTCNP